MSQIWDNIKVPILIILAMLIILGFFFLLGYYSGTTNERNKHKEPEPTTPVEKIVFDTLYIKRDSIIYRTQYIKEVQHDTIEKIYLLDDSSTLKLFYQLVSE